MADKSPPLAWHAVEYNQALESLESKTEGLSTEDAKDRLARFGPNLLAKAKRESPFQRFLKQFDNVLIYVLLASSAGTALLDNWIDTGVILGVVVINAVIGYVQEGKAEQALDSIAKMMSLTALVTRDTRQIRIDAQDVVPGDIVHVKAGDRVPADLRLLEASALETLEAALTGESLPVEKHPRAVFATAPLAERFSLAYAGTLVTQGRGLGLVVATGQSTEMGKIGTLLASVETLATPLLRRIAGFASGLAIAILILAGGIFLLAWLGRDFALEESFMAAVSLAVAAIPEGLPAILTIAMAVGVRRMAARNALIRRLPAVETLGSVTIICTDKTGTLTQNKMSVTALEPSTAGEEALLKAALLCNDAALHHENGILKIEGAATETALLHAAISHGLDVDRIRADCPRLDEIPFDSASKRMVTLHQTDRATACLYVKGAPEGVMGLCDPQQRQEWEKRAFEQAARGRRVLAVAGKEITDDSSEGLSDQLHGMTLLGLIALSDPPRPEAIAAVAACRNAGVAVCMITGDHAETARAIANQLAIGTDGPVLTGPEIDALDDASLSVALETARVVARATPEHKLRLVTAFQARGDIVAMTGDGVNDAPALKKADIGVAMGAGGTEAAKEAAMMVLADDNFATIAEAIREGRAVYDNLKKSIAYILPVNIAQAVVIIVAVIAGVALPITPLQILWVNMVTAVTLTMALAFEPAETGIMDKPPRPPGEAIITPFQIWRLVLVTALIVAASFGLFLLTLENGGAMTEARTAAVNALVGCEIAYLFNMRFLTAPSWHSKAILGSKPVLISVAVMALLQAAFTYLPPMQSFFETKPISLAAWAWIFAASLALFAVIEMEKAALRLIKSDRPRRSDHPSKDVRPS